MISLQKDKLKPFHITEIAPQGWLKRQLEIQMNGLTGRLYDIWDSVGSYSGWLGGTGENWERAPYYLDGLLPLSFYLHDDKQFQLALRFIEWTLSSQDEEGNFGPEASKYDYWSRFVMLKVLIQYYEIQNDSRVLPFFGRYFDYLYQAMQEIPAAQWARARIGDLLFAIHWYYDHTKDASVFSLVEILRRQALDWVDQFEHFAYVRPAAYYYNWKKEQSHFSKEQLDDTMNYHTNHIVNLTMGFKYPAMLSYFFKDKDFEKISLQGLESAIRYHGVVSGAINGDEHLSGNNPSQGSELCSVVEYMFSLYTMLERFGNPDFADRLERLAFNALPATITEDFMGHQYLQQANQVLVSKAPRQWFNTNEESNLFGLEPNFGCCTANMHQGWPKFVKTLWFYDDEDSSLVSMVFAPSRLDTVIGGKALKVSLKTEYPFKNTLTYRFEEAGDITLKFRVPQWCKEFQLTKNDLPMTKKDYELQKGSVRIRHLNSGDSICFIPKYDVIFSSWYNNSLAVERGPLVYGLDIEEEWHAIREVNGVRDYEIYPASAWNIALDKNSTVKEEEFELGDVPFSKNTPPVVLTMKGQQLDSWQLVNNSAGDLPVSPVNKQGSEEQEVRLIPFGCTKLRVSEFPYFE